MAYSQSACSPNYAVSLAVTLLAALIGSVAVSPAAALIVAEEAAVAEDLVEVEGVRAVVMAVVVVVVAMAMENLVYRRRRLPTVRRAGCAVRLHVGGCACSSWDRCGRCMTDLPASCRDGHRAESG